MRLWSLHPSLLDAQGLVTLWREALLAQKVLKGKTRGYRHHPQLHRFRRCGRPIAAITSYLWAVHDEAIRRGYSFDASKIQGMRRSIKIPVNRGQLEFELQHLARKVRARDRPCFHQLRQARRIKQHPLFNVVAGEVEFWERGADNVTLT